jgi:hypothetical protein
MMSRFVSLRPLGFALAALALTIVAAPAEAQPNKRVRNACESDARRLCPREKGDTPEMRYCMEAKGRQLSSNCIRALEDDGTIPRGHFGKGR